MVIPLDVLTRKLEIRYGQWDADQGAEGRARCITIENCVVESSISTFANVFAARTFQNWRYRSLSNTSR
jgi:hypothetical protein